MSSPFFEHVYTYRVVRLCVFLVASICVVPLCLKVMYWSVQTFVATRQKVSKSVSRRESSYGSIFSEKTPRTSFKSK